MGVSQRMVSLLQNSGEVDGKRLKEVAKAPGVSLDVIKNFSEEAVFQCMGNTYTDQSSSVNYGCTFNPIDKLEVDEEIYSFMTGC